MARRMLPRCLGADTSRKGPMTSVESTTFWDRIRKINHYHLAASAVVLAILIVAAVMLGSRRSEIFPVLENDKYGYINASGQLVIRPQFDRAGQFSDGLAPVALGKRW